jgi:hypothetical protein
MKPVKNFLFAMLLVSAMAVNTIAGVQDTPGYVGPPDPPQPPRQMTTYEDTTGTVSNTEEAGGITVETADYLFFEVLTALLSVY